MIIKEIEQQQYDEFNKTLINYNFFQTSLVTLSRKYNYKDAKFLGLYENAQLIGTTQILEEIIPYFNKKIGYSIKGLNFDLSNEEILKKFKESMQRYLKANNFLLFRFDLNLAYQFYDSEFNKVDSIKNFPYDNEIKQKLKKMGYINFDICPNYMGRSPKWSMLVDTSSKDAINDQLNRSVKRAIKTSIDIGVEIVRSKDSQNIKSFYDLHLQNAKRNNINIMDIEYYENLIQINYVNLYTVKINKEKFLEYANKKFLKNKNSKNEKLLNLAQEYQGQYVLGHISGMFNNMGYDMFTGLDYTYKDLGVKEYLMKNIFLDANEKEIKYYDFWGIVAKGDYQDDPMYPIYLFKKKFSNIIIEYPGFWDIHTNKLLYKAFVTLYKIRYKKKH